MAKQPGVSLVKKPCLTPVANAQVETPSRDEEQAQPSSTQVHSAPHPVVGPAAELIFRAEDKYGDTRLVDVPGQAAVLHCPTMKAGSRSRIVEMSYKASGKPLWYYQGNVWSGTARVDTSAKVSGP